MVAKSQSDAGSNTVDTALGAVEYFEQGEGAPVLFVRGSPGGGDQGIAMSRFLVPQGFRAIAPSRPGYLGTPLTDSMATPDQQADLELALMDALGVEQFAVMCWSGGGPSTYRLAAKHGDRVTALVMCAAVSKPYSFGKASTRSSCRPTSRSTGSRSARTSRCGPTRRATPCRPASSTTCSADRRRRPTVASIARALHAA